MSFFRHLLWVDCTAGALVGVIVIAISDWLAKLEGFPREVLLFTGIVNVLYACYSFSLAVRAERPMGRINVLVFANLAWVPVCIGLVVFFRDQANVFGFVHMIGEALFVGGLALLEWKHRDKLLSRA